MNALPSSFSDEKIDLISPIAIATRLGYKLNNTQEVEDLKVFVWESLRAWGMVPASDKRGQSASSDEATYSMDCNLIRDIVIQFFDKDMVLTKPSQSWYDSASIAINLKLPGEFCRSSLSEFVTNSLLDIFNLYPVKGRMGAEGPTVNARDGGIYPGNNPLVQRLVRSYFTDGNLVQLPSGETGRSYISKVSA